MNTNPVRGNRRQPIGLEIQSILVPAGDSFCKFIWLTRSISQGTSSPSTGSSPSKKDANGPQISALEKHLLESGPIREDGSDKFWGLENVRAASFNPFESIG